MNIIGIIGISLLIGLLALAIGMLVYITVDPYRERLWLAVIFGITIVATACSVLVGIGLTTEYERVYVEKFNAQKETIEQSIASESMTGYERATIVSNVSEINAELAERKARYNRWYFVCYDDSIYDNVEPIDLRGENK